MSDLCKDDPLEWVDDFRFVSEPVYCLPNFGEMGTKKVQKTCMLWAEFVRYLDPKCQNKNVNGYIATLPRTPTVSRI